MSLAVSISLVCVSVLKQFLKCISVICCHFICLSSCFKTMSLVSLRSRRLEVVGQRENERARGRHSRAPVFSCAHYTFTRLLRRLVTCENVSLP